MHEAKIKVIGRLNQVLQSIKTRLRTNFNDIAGMKRNDIMNSLYTVLIITFCPALIAVLFRQSEFFAVSFFGTLFTNLADPGGLYRIRMRTMALGAGLLIISNLLAALVGQLPILLVCSMLFWVFISSMLSVYGKNIGSRLGSIAIVSFILFTAQTTDLSFALPHCLIIAASALWVMACKLRKWPFKPDQPVREAVANYYRLLSSRLVLVLSRENETYVQGPGDKDILQKSIQTARNLAYLVMRDLKGKFNPTTLKMYVLLQKADSLFTIQVALSESIKTASFQNYQSSVQKSVDQAVTDTDAVLTHIASSIQYDKPVGVKSNFEPILQKLTGHFTALQEGPPESGDYLALSSARYIIGLLERYIKTLQGIVGIIDNVNLASSVKSNKPEKQSSAILNAWRLLADHLTLGSDIFRFSLILSTMLAIATFIYTFFHIPHGYWMALTIAIVLKPDFQTARQRALQRVVGTVAGGIIAIVAASLIQNRNIIFLLIIVLVFLAFANRSRNYGIYALFWTPAVVFLVNFQDIGNWLIALTRIANTVAGGVIASIYIFFFLPQLEKAQLPDKIAKALFANRNYVQAILDMYSGKIAPPTNIERIHQQANRACIDASAALRGVSNGPLSKGDYFKRLAGLTAFNQQLCNILAALSLENLQLTECEVLPDIQIFLKQYSEILQSTEIAVRSGQQPDRASAFENGVPAEEVELSSSIVAHIDELAQLPVNASQRNFISAYIPFRIYLRRLVHLIDGLYGAVVPADFALVHD
jgi:uncharacterized membrane protein YccC